MGVQIPTSLPAVLVVALVGLCFLVNVGSPELLLYPGTFSYEYHIPVDYKHWNHITTFFLKKEEEEEEKNISLSY